MSPMICTLCVSSSVGCYSFGFGLFFMLSSICFQVISGSAVFQLIVTFLSCLSATFLVGSIGLNTGSAPSPAGEPGPSFVNVLDCLKDSGDTLAAADNVSPEDLYGTMKRVVNAAQKGKGSQDTNLLLLRSIGQVYLVRGQIDSTQRAVIECAACLVVCCNALGVKAGEKEEIGLLTVCYDWVEPRC